MAETQDFEKGGQSLGHPNRQCTDLEIGPPAGGQSKYSNKLTPMWFNLNTMASTNMHKLLFLFFVLFSSPSYSAGWGFDTNKDPATGGFIYYTTKKLSFLLHCNKEKKKQNVLVLKHDLTYSKTADKGYTHHARLIYLSDEGDREYFEGVVNLKPGHSTLNDPFQFTAVSDQQQVLRFASFLARANSDFKLLLRFVGKNPLIGSNQKRWISFNSRTAAISGIRFGSHCQQKKLSKLGWLGITSRAVSKDVAYALGLKNTAGAIVTKVAEAGPAKTAGILERDVILRLGDIKIVSNAQLSNTVQGMPPGKKIHVVVWRRDKEFIIPVTLGEMPKQLLQDHVAKGAAEKPLYVKFAGMKVSALSPVLRIMHDLSVKITGVVVTKVDEGSVSHRKNIVVGSVITAVNGKVVDSPKSLHDAIRKSEASGKKAILLQISHKSRIRFVGIPLSDSRPSTARPN